MENLNQAIENHYYKSGLLEDICKRLEEQGIALTTVKRTDLSRADEFHVRGDAVSKELATAIAMNGMTVLDVGCGLGGPCRMLADEFDCETTGIDLSNEYIRTATGLSKLVGLDGETTFIQGNATELPFEDHRFEVVWTQHVQMNIPDKRKFYSEINRVLKPGGHFLYYDIFKRGDGAVSYPMPWASKEAQSFLFEAMEMKNILAELNLSPVVTTDQTQAGIGFFESFVARLKTSGPPKMGLNVLMGESTGAKLMNLLSHLQKGALRLESGVYKK